MDLVIELTKCKTKEVERMITYQLKKYFIYI